MKSIIKYLVIIMIVAISLPDVAWGQRMSHGSKGGGARSAPNMSRPAQQPSRSNVQSRPNTQQPRQNTPQARPAQQPNRSINGGHQKSNDRNLSTKSPSTRPSTGTRDVRPVDNRNNNKSNIKRNNQPATRDKSVPSRGGNNVNVNINNSRNVNVHRHGPTMVRPPVRPYYRPPYVYGGYRFYCYHPYHYHPYRPYYWGPMWHPWGFFVTTVAVTAIIINIENQKYYYDQGVYYVQSNDGYTVVEAPVGATVKELPKETQTVVINETTNNYYYGGTYYEKTEEGYEVVPPTAGTLVENLPEGGEEVKVGDVTYVKLGEIYYQPVEVDGENMYEVVNVEEDEEE